MHRYTEFRSNAEIEHAIEVTWERAQLQAEFNIVSSFPGAELSSSSFMELSGALASFSLLGLGLILTEKDEQ